MTGIKITTTLERTLYLDLPEKASEEEIQKAVDQQVIMPNQALLKVAEVLKKTNIRIDGLDLSDWSLVKSDFKVI